MAKADRLIGGRVGPNVRTSLADLLFPLNPPIPEEEKATSVHARIDDERIAAAAVSDPYEALRVAFSARNEYEVAPNAGEALRLYHRIAVFVERASQLFVEIRLQDYSENEVVDTVLWDEIARWETTGRGLSAITLAGVVAAELLLVERLGEDRYLEELAERRRRSSASIRTLRRVWRGEGSGEYSPVFCTQCHQLLGESLNEAIESVGAIVGVLGPWGRCPRCNQPTVIRN